MKTYLKRWEAVAEIELREIQNSTIEQRWHRLNAIIGMAIGLGLKPSDDDELEVYQRWAKLKEKATNQNPVA